MRARALSFAHAIVVLSTSGCYLAHEREVPPEPPLEFLPECHPRTLTVLEPAAPPENRGRGEVMSISDDARWLTYAPYVVDEIPDDYALPDLHSFLLDFESGESSEVGVSSGSIHRLGAYISGDGSTLLIPDGWDPAEAVPVPDSVTLIDRVTRVPTAVPVPPLPFGVVAISDDGTRLAFQQCVPEPGEVSCWSPFFPTVLDVRTGERTYFADRGDAYDFAFSGNGERMAFAPYPAHPRSDYPEPTFDTYTATMSDPRSVSIGAMGWRGDPHVSDDGRVVVTSRGDLQPPPLPSTTVRTPRGIDLVVWREDGAPEGEALCAGPTHTWPVYDAALSGDGSAIIVSTATGFATNETVWNDGLHHELVRIDLDEGTVQLLARCSTIGIVTSADGRTVVVNAYEYACPDVDFPDDGPTVDEDGNYIGYEGTSILVFRL